MPDLPLNRRHFNYLLLSSGIATLSSPFLLPREAWADSSSLSSTQEVYHLFVDSKTAQEGGKQKITLKSGQTPTIKIPRQTIEGHSIIQKGYGVNRNTDAVIILHTLYEPAPIFLGKTIDELIETIIATAPVTETTRSKLRTAYILLKAGAAIIDASLELLDTLVFASEKIKQIRELLKEKKEIAPQDNLELRYKIASQNARLVKLQNYIEQTVEQSKLSSQDKTKLKGIYQYIKAGEALPSGDYLPSLAQLDVIVEGSNLPLSLRQRYFLSSSQTRAFTTDEIILNLIKKDNYTAGETDKYLAVYYEIRSGGKITDKNNLLIVGDLNRLIKTSSIPEECKTIYDLTRNNFLENNQQYLKNSLDELWQKGFNLYDTGKYIKGVGQDIWDNASSIVSTTTQLLAKLGVSAGTGTAISTLSGGAATNATLAFLGGGSVAAGGFGMLGGLVVVTGGAALMGAATLVSISLVAGMNKEDLTKLGIATTTGVATSATVMATAWATVTTFGSAAGFTGAAQISTAIASLGGIGVMTGGVALLAFGVSLGVWQLLNNKDEVTKVIEQIEPMLYTFVEETKSPIVTTIIHSVCQGNLRDLADTTEQQEKCSQAPLFSIYQENRLAIAPTIPVDKLKTAFATVSKSGNFDTQEKILAIIDIKTSDWVNNLKSVVFTSSGLYWEDNSTLNLVKYSDSDFLFKIKKLPDAGNDEEGKNIFNLVTNLQQIYRT